MTFLAALPALLSAASSAYSAYQSTRSQQDKVRDFDIYSPKQKQLIDLMSDKSLGATGSAFDYLKDLFSNDANSFKDFEAPALRQFEEEIIPKIMERFGAAGALSSSGLNQTLAREGGNLAEKLASLRAGSRQNALGALGNFQQNALTQPQGRYLQKGTPGNPEAFGTNVQNIITQLGSLMNNNSSSNQSQSAQGGYNALPLLAQQFSTGELT